MRQQTKTVSKKQQSNRKTAQPRRGLKRYVVLHMQSFIASLGRLWRTPIASGMTIAVVGIALALPTGLYLLLQNVQTLSRGWDNGAQISLYLKMSVTPDQAQDLVQQLRTETDIAKVQYISPTQGLKQFEQESGFGDVVRQLHTNPLPAVIVVHPAQAMQSPANINLLLQRLKLLPQVNVAQLDMTWIKRLYGIIKLGKRFVFGICGLLAIAVLLIIGNTIRLAIQNRREEIQVIKLVGATKGFIRRPFLYTGILYGFLGAIIAYLLITFFLLLLDTPVEQLAGLYQTDFYLRSLDSLPTLVLFIAGIGLGLIGAWFAVGRQLKRIEPQ